MATNEGQLTLVRSSSQLDSVPSVIDTNAFQSSQIVSPEEIQPTSNSMINPSQHHSVEGNDVQQSQPQQQSQQDVQQSQPQQQNQHDVQQSQPQQQQRQQDVLQSQQQQHNQQDVQQSQPQQEQNQDVQQPQLQQQNQQDVQQPQSQQQQPQQQGVHQPPQQQQPQPFGVEDHCAFRLRKMNDIESRRIMHLIFFWGTQGVKSPNMTLEEYLLQVKKIPWNIYKNAFNKDQRDSIRSDPGGDTFDVSLLYLSIKWACEGVEPPRSSKWSDAGDNLERTLTYIKGFRNDIMHEDSRLSKPDFMQKTKRLRDLLSRSLVLAGNVYSIDRTTIDAHLGKMNENINSIRDSPLVNYNITSYDNQLLYTDLVNLLKNDGKEEVAEYYNTYSNFNPVSFITGEQLHLDVGLIFTCLVVIDNEKRTQHDQGNDNLNVEYEEMLQFGNTPEETSNKVKLLEGPAGSGKTTLTRKMIGDWVSGTSNMINLTSFNLLIYMECRDSTKSSFSQLLTSLMPKTAKRFSNDDLVKCTLGLKLFIIVDGIDELNKSSTQLFREILNLKKSHNITLFCTTRPEKVEDCYKMMPSGEKTTHLKIIGIKDTQREEFACKYHEEMRRLGKSNQETKGLIKYLNTTGNRLQEHWCLPLNLVLLTVLWAIAPARVNCVTTATELYFEIYKLTIEKLLERLKGKEQTQNLDVYTWKYKIDMFVLKLCCEALVSLKNDEIILSDESIKRLQKICFKAEIPVDETLGAFLVSKNTWTATGMLSKISFPHKGIQDFFSAVCVLIQLKERGVNINTSKVINFELDMLNSHTSPQVQGSTTSVSPPFTSSSSVDSPIRRNIFARGFHKIRKRSSASLHRFRRLEIVTKMVRSVSVPVLNFMGVNTEISGKITEILEELHREEGDDINFYKFNNAFVHLTGLLHITSENNIDRDLVVELVKILFKTGIKKKEQWLDLLANVKCDGVVAEIIAERIPSITEEHTTIEDKRVYSYNSLYQKMCPKSVNVNISSNPQVIPRLEELLLLLCKHESKVEELDFHHEFQHPEKGPGIQDNTLLQVFEKCSVKYYRGVMRASLGHLLPDTITRLRVSVENHEEYCCLNAVLTSTTPTLPWLRRLVLHVSSRVDYTKLKPLPLGLNVHLYLSDVDSSNLEWSFRTASVIQPDDAINRRGYTTILFPRCKLGETDFEHLIKEFVKAKVCIETALCTSANLREESVTALQLLCKRKQLTSNFCLMGESEIWSKW